MESGRADSPLSQGAKAVTYPITRCVKKTIMIVAGFCWLGFALGLGWFLFQYLGGGAGLQVFGFQIGPSPGTVVIGVIHFLGFVAGAVLCFVIGVGLCAQGMSRAAAGE